jgi:glycosyltransferase involved in cell wall biosynthesis
MRQQTFKDFEWLIVDDGSTDRTNELVNMWQKEASFPIRYFYQTNRGKHVAFNRGVREASGLMFLAFDSDDTCPREAFERFHHYWCCISAGQRQRFSTITGLCSDQKGNIHGYQYPAPVIDAYDFVSQWKLRRCERWGINRTDVLRRFPFPEFKGECYIPEALVWERISCFYATRFFNEVVRFYEALRPGSITADYARIRAGSPKGTSLYYRELMGRQIPLRPRARALLNYIRFSPTELKVVCRTDSSTKL